MKITMAIKIAKTVNIDPKLATLAKEVSGSPKFAIFLYNLIYVLATSLKVVFNGIVPTGSSLVVDWKTRQHGPQRISHLSGDF